MLNIIKSQMYGIRCNMFTYIGIAIAIVCIIVETVSTVNDIGSESATGSLLFAISGEFNSVFSFLVVCIVVPCVVGWDFDDKTINYEILYGHSRFQVYWTRTVTAIILAIISAVIFMITPTLIFTVKNGWGYAITVKEAVTRLFLLIFPLLRLSAYAVFITFLVRKSWGGAVICFAFLYAETFLSLLESSKLKYLLVMNIMEVMNFSNMSYGFENGKDVMIFKDTLGSQFIIITIILSVVIFAGALLSGYAVFRKRNLN